MRWCCFDRFCDRIVIKLKTKNEMDYSLKELFPELNAKLNPSVYSPKQTDLENNTYFTHLVQNILGQYGPSDQKGKRPTSQGPFPLKDVHEFTDIKALIQKILPKVVPVKVPKGTVVYTLGSSPDQGYILIHGCVELLAKKNNWERLESYPKHTLFNLEDRVEYLNSNYRIQAKHFETMEAIFYEDKMSFNFLPFSKLYSGEYFGFKELLRGCMRTKMAVAVEDCLLVKIRRQDFDKYLKDYEEKREQYVINCIFSSVKPEIVEEVLPRITMAFNAAELISFDKDEAIYTEGDFSSGLFVLLNGEVIESKEVKLEVPKKFLVNENQKQVMKEVKVNLHRLIKNSLVGEIEHLMGIKRRQFTCRASENSTLLLKLDAASFLKTISESSLYEKELIWAAKSRYSSTSDLFLRQKDKIMKSYLNQFETFDHKKKEKNIVCMLNNETNFKKNGLYELFKREGTFYRDTFERLEGFEEFQDNHDPKRSSIHRHKIKSSLEEATAGNHRSAMKAKKNLEERSLTEEGDLSYEATKKILMSPGKVTNQFEVFSAEFMQKLSPVSENQEGSRLKKKKNIIPKFQELKKDEVVFKRVLIKNGKYEVSRETNKSNIVQAIVNHKFDSVVKQCMNRKSVALRKATADNRNDILKEEFRKTLSTMPQKSSSMTRLTSTSVGYTCKGTDEMRKKLDKLKWFKGTTSSWHQKPGDNPRLDECIGFNRQPLSRQIKRRSSITSKVSLARSGSPEKIVLLNHMMKPVTYTSAQI